MWRDVIDSRRFDLILMDLDGTLIGSHVQDDGSGALVKVRPYMDVVVIPGRLEALAALAMVGVQVAIVTNQGGAAFRYQTTAEVALKLTRAAGALGIALPAGGGFPAQTQPKPGGTAYGKPGAIYCALGHPKAIMPALRTKPGDSWRKPGEGMIRQAVLDRDVDPDRVLMVGDLDSDREAAFAAGVDYMDVVDFFGSTEIEEGL